MKSVFSYRFDFKHTAITLKKKKRHVQYVIKYIKVVCCVDVAAAQL